MLKLCLALCLLASAVALDKYVVKNSQYAAVAPEKPEYGGKTNYIKGINNQDTMYDGPKFPAAQAEAPKKEVSNSNEEPFSEQEMKDGKQRADNEKTFVSQMKAKKCSDCANKPADDAERPNSVKRQGRARGGGEGGGRGGEWVKGGATWGGERGDRRQPGGHARGTAGGRARTLYSVVGWSVGQVLYVWGGSGQEAADRTGAVLRED